ncbi:MAG: CDP-alcohol phosphatidyltransferase family protein [Bryobacterales bacterium]|nr:CDP-alcohol phosphatidyltransferase family protein [Bryobacterales bacterium]
MTYTAAIGKTCNWLLVRIVEALALSRIHPNVLTFLGLVINGCAAYLLGTGRFWQAGLVIIGAGIFDMVDGRVARRTNQVTRFGGFFDSVIDRYSDLVLLIGLLVYYGNANRSTYVVLTAIVMMASVMISYTRARAENELPQCKVGFMERPERVVLMIIGALFNKMAPVLWVIAVLGTITVVGRMMYTWRELKPIDEQSMAEQREASRQAQQAKLSNAVATSKS